MATETRSVDVPPPVLDYLQEHSTLTLATASPAGVPRATTLLYANDGVVLYVWTRPDTTTARQIEQNPVVSFAIDEYTPDLRQTKGIQATGKAEVVVSPDEIDRAQRLFDEKFSTLKGALTTNISFFRVTPTELEFIDNTSGDGEAKDALHYQRDLVYSVFGDLPPEQASMIRGKLQTVTIKPGSLIVRQGAPADKFFIIVDGEVEVLREEGDETHSVAHLGGGQFFGEMAILRDMPRAATVQAVSETTLFAMERDVFRTLVAQSLGTTENFDRVIQQRLDELASLERS